MVVVNNPSEGKPSMGRSIGNLAAVTRVGLDLAKKVFQVHAVDAKGEIVVARKLHARRQPGKESELSPRGCREAATEAPLLPMRWSEQWRAMGPQQPISGAGRSQPRHRVRQRPAS